MRPDVPLIVPEVNPDHLELITCQPYPRPGCIITNPNCSTIGLVLALKPLHDAFGIRAVQVTTMQAVSGAGYPGVSSLDIFDNVIPYISGEEEKLEHEVIKILGTLETRREAQQVLQAHQPQQDHQAQATQGQTHQTARTTRRGNSSIDGGGSAECCESSAGSGSTVDCGSTAGSESTGYCESTTDYGSTAVYSSPAGGGSTADCGSTAASNSNSGSVTPAPIGITPQAIGITPAPILLSASCHRVPVLDGHLESVSVKLAEKADSAALLKAWEQFSEASLTSGLPLQRLPLCYLPEKDRPQPRLDRSRGSGMTVSVGRLRPCSVLDWKFEVLVHNTLRGAAGGAVLLGELYAKKAGLIEQYC